MSADHLKPVDPELLRNVDLVIEPPWGEERLLI
jgi:hypothetical protein